MGRQSTGAITTREITRIELSYLLRQGFIKKGQVISGILSWNNGSKIGIESFYNNEERCLKLSYCFTSNETGEREDFEYSIQLTTIPSNLGRGEIVYFLCPITGRRARILYKCYGSKIWKSKGAYRHRIYYASQQCSKYDLHNIRYWALEKEIERCIGRSKKKHYQGNETRLRNRIKLLEEKKNYHDWARWAFLPKTLLKGLSPSELKYLQEGG